MREGVEGAVNQSKMSDVMREAGYKLDQMIASRAYLHRVSAALSSRTGSARLRQRGQATTQGTASAKLYSSMTVVPSVSQLVNIASSWCERYRTFHDTLIDVH